ncbi:MAG: YerC/YecD family TrpR-related protein [bacterium]|nr:YerC/YecD family TrpR-related protein [bacterium]
MDWKKIEKRKLLQAVLSLKTEKEAAAFLRDLMTEKEIDEFAKRLKAAEMLADKIPYTVIEKTTGLSSTTVARVAKWLNSQAGGYRTIISRLHHNNPVRPRRGLS